MLADDVLFITAANILAHFDLSDAVSLDGSDIKYDGNGIIRSFMTFSPSSVNSADHHGYLQSSAPVEVSHHPSGRNIIQPCMNRASTPRNGLSTAQHHDMAC